MKQVLIMLHLNGFDLLTISYNYMAFNTISNELHTISSSDLMYQ